MMTMLHKDKPVSLRYILLCFVGIITFLCYSHTLSNEFTNWDDNLYVKDNPYIKNLDGDNLKMILFHNVTNNYYHPITMLSIALNYRFSKMEPFGYYFTNVSIHVLNTCLMFLLLLALFKAMEEKGYGIMKGNELFAAFGALCYGIHPMHVESVSWFAERKDVLYAFFYFLGLISYLKYLKEEKIKWIVSVVILYLLSVLSKPMAVVFPLSLFAIDVLLKRKFSGKTLLEKVPMLIISVIVGLWAFKAQESSGSMQISLYAITAFQRAMVASYGFVMYLVKAIVPFDLCAFYPYPALTSSGSFPSIFYFMPFIALLVIVVPIYLAYKANNNYLRLTLFGFGFYLFNIVFVLQLVSSGPTMMSERYTYVSYLGIFVMLTYLLQQVWVKWTSARITLRITMTGFVVMLGITCFGRTRVWHNTETLFTDVIDKYPGRVAQAYINLGAYYGEKGDINKAYIDYKSLADMHLPVAMVYNNLGNIYNQRRQFDSARMAYSQAIKLDSTDFHPYVDRGMTYARQHKYDSALFDYDHAFRLDSTAEKLLANRAFAFFMIKQYDMAAKDYSRAIRVNANKADYYFNRGVAEMNIGDLNAAQADFIQDLNMDPRNKDCLYDMYLLYSEVGDNRATEYLSRAEAEGYKVSANTTK